MVDGVLFVEHQCQLFGTIAAYKRSWESKAIARTGRSLIATGQCCVVWACVKHRSVSCRLTGCRDRHAEGKWAWLLAHRAVHDVWYVHGAHTGFRRRAAGWFKLLP